MHRRSERSLTTKQPATAARADSPAFTADASSDRASVVPGHNFLRYIENWSGKQLNYRGSIIRLYDNRQATGIFKGCVTVYSPPTRGYNFDVEFLTPSLLPPRTPMFQDVNTTGFLRLILANQ